MKLTVLIIVSIIALSSAFRVKPGRCSRIGKGYAGICASYCMSDFDCSGSLKCCSNGCGHTCMSPIFPKAPPRNLNPVRNGKCPDTSHIITACIIKPGHCYNDMECSPGKKCCSYGCNKKCLPIVNF